MTPEKKFNSEVWWVLQKIKEAYLKTPPLESLLASGRVRIFPKPSATIKASEIIEIEKLQRDGYTVIYEPYGTEFKTGSIVSASRPSEDDQKRIIYILQGKGALKILNENSNDWEGTKFILQIIQPKFDGIYKKYESVVSDIEEQKKRDKILQGLANQQQQISQIPSAWQEYERKQKEKHEENERAFQQRIDREHKEAESRELARIQRIAASGKPPLIYTMDKIIEKCLVDQSAARVEIDFYSLGFEDNLTEVCNAHRFFNQLKENGCFEDVERSANTWFVVTHPNIEKLKKYRANLEKELSLSQKIVQDNVLFNYNPETGDGLLKGKKFRLSDGVDYKKLFDATFLVKKKKLPREEVIKILCLEKQLGNVNTAAIFSALGDDKTRRKSTNEVAITNKINEVVKKVRSKTGLNTQEFVNNKGNITLNV